MIMKAFTIDRYKSKDGGHFIDMPQPAVGDNDVLVQVHAAGVNLLDAKIASGELKLVLPYRFPLILGNDVAGVVVQVGPVCGASNRATRSMRDRTRIGSAPSRSSSP
jgi:NADPH:quinone reductase-like Zn-dependent oxidoreductase